MPDDATDFEMPLRLVDAPDWHYLIQEFDTLYRQASVCGSRLIRAHR